MVAVIKQKKTEKFFECLDHFIVYKTIVQNSPKWQNFQSSGQKQSSISIYNLSGISNHYRKIL